MQPEQTQTCSSTSTPQTPVRRCPDLLPQSRPVQRPRQGTQFPLRHLRPLHEREPQRQLVRLQRHRDGDLRSLPSGNGQGLTLWEGGAEGRGGCGAQGWQQDRRRRADGGWPALAGPDWWRRRGLLCGGRSRTTPTVVARWRCSTVTTGVRWPAGESRCRRRRGWAWPRVQVGLADARTGNGGGWCEMSDVCAVVGA